jgi:hypothetical protein
MKNILSVLLLAGFILACSNNRLKASPGIDQNPDLKLSDSVLQSLYKNNQLVFGVAFENHSWGHNATYRVFVMNNDQWTAYTWYSNYSQPGIVPNVNPAMISADTCKAILNFLKENNIENIKGDLGKPGCGGTNSNCNINDGATWHLFSISKGNVIAPSYYEPQFYEDCCPGNKDRKQFLAVVNKIVSVLDLNQNVR